MKLNNKTYDVLMILAQIIFPAVATFYVALSGIWGLPAADKVTGSIMAIDTFLGIILKVLKSGYEMETDGSLVVDNTDPAKTMYSLELGVPVDTIHEMKQVTLGVVKAGLSREKHVV